ncbi:MAG TPA: radical SAM protein [Chloroflexi bacterium]|nr:radical SAM protein [Chloroflexota bacterium]
MFVLHPQDLGIILTYRCHSRCQHCLYNCGPGWGKEAMSPQQLRQALEQVLVWPQTPQVHLTGGEPFLHFPLLLEGTRMAAGLSIPVYVETSGSWCTDEGEAVERFVALREAGLQAVLVSCSPFHAERIPPARTVRAIRAALHVFGPRRVTVYLSQFLDLIQQFSAGDLGRPIPLSRYEEELGPARAAQVLWEGYGLISGGRAGYRLGHLTARHPAAAFSRATCAGELLYAQHSHFDLDGNFIPAFCGGLTVGSWRDLSRLLDDFQEDRYPPLIAALIEGGPYRLYELARERYGYESRPEGYAGKCHLCVDVRRRLAEADDFVELRPREFYHHF